MYRIVHHEPDLAGLPPGPPPALPPVRRRSTRPAVITAAVIVTAAVAALAVTGVVLHLPARPPLHVGCGGTMKDWAVLCDDSPEVSGTRNSLVRDDVPGHPGYGTCAVR